VNWLRMRPTTIYGLLALLAIAVAIAPSPAFAHHGVAAYDYTKTVTAKVTVTQFDWGNPHCKIHFDVTDDLHAVEHWVIEMHPPDALLDHGWTRQSLHAGDVISVSFRPAKRGSTIGLVEEVTLPNGVALRQNVLLLPPGQTMSIQEWIKRYHRQPIEPAGSSAR